MDKIRILQLGKEDFRTQYELPDTVELTYVERLTEFSGKPYDLVFLDRTPRKGELALLRQAAKAYTLFITEHVDVEEMGWLYQEKRAKRIDRKDVQKFLLQEAHYYYRKPYGEKLKPCNLTISRNFSGSVKWNGNYSVSLNGDFGNEFGQTAYWRNNIPVFQGQRIDLWLEYKKDPGVSVSLVITGFIRGSISEILERKEFSEEELNDVIQIGGFPTDASVFLSLHAKGSGALSIIALHDRHSRGSHGFFLPGGKRCATSEREEVFYYFEPGDGKPPLNVFFSGYKTRQGFEGYNLMKKLGSPFLLLAEARLEGGCFYMGSKEYERLYVRIIRNHMKKLGFSPGETIFSGLSMGAYGALYYSCAVRPHAVILGKPLASIGNVAANETYLRPGGFPTSLDVLKYLCQNMDRDAVKKLNDRFWNKFDAVDWGNTKFIMSYMAEDDYDPDAYQTLLSHLCSGGVQVYGKGIHGRHNDNTMGVIHWFLGQFEKILKEDFFRKMED